MTSSPLPLDPQELPQHLPSMRRVARALCVSDRRADADADDLVQDTLERVLRRPRMITGEPGPYLSQAVRHAFRDRQRAQRSRVRLVAEPEGFAPPDPHAGDHAQIRAEARELLGALDALSTPHRQAVVALDLLGLSAREASTAIGIPAGTVESRAHRGRARITGRMAA